ncbi:hypothetical protein TUM17384_14480 [Shewanella algae]|uniref:dTDP-4-amino-4,6-dideoxyglucose formyltransferase n=1 Tax=Shewanella algae TaxID=38313 RepID=UPI001BEF5339|nr:dTDP-4-amino-4,6-dideoxyglucose formyltransferase [Shewanella algae]BCV57503.1 hypothetical protein TUM17384_14480 [Shewanella algae]
MKKVLIISDNYELVSFLKELTISNSYNAKFDYKYSHINNSPELLRQLGLQSVNVKDDDVVEYIINEYDLVISAHCKQIFPKKLVDSVRCINIHPGLNPHNRGWFPQVFSIINKKPIGCTIHEMNDKVDHGEIIYQESVDVYPDDDSFKVYQRVVQTEKKLIRRYLNDLVNKQYVSKPMFSEGNYNGIEDFKKLCELKLESISTLGEHIDLLRALTHGEFKNAYFIKKWCKVLYKCQNRK